MSSASIGRRLDSGLLFPAYHGVYTVGVPIRTATERAAAAVLACGPRALLAELWALALWGFAPWPLGPPQVLIRGERKGPRGVAARRSKSVLDREVRIRDRIPVTSPSRTVLDAAALLGVRQRRRIVNDALRTPRLRHSELMAICVAHPHHPGAVLLDPFLNTTSGPSHSDWEDDFPAECRLHGVPEPRMNVMVCGYPVHAVWDEVRLIGELDGWQFHRDREPFESDRDRDANTLLGGYATIRFTKRRCERDPRREFARLNAIIASRRKELGR